MTLYTKTATQPLAFVKGKKPCRYSETTFNKPKPPTSLYKDERSNKGICYYYNELRLCCLGVKT